MLILALLMAFLWAAPAYADHAVGHNGVITINEWNSGNVGPYPLWFWHNTNVYTTPQAGCPASPSGGGSIRGNFAPGVKTSSTAGGSSSYEVPTSANITTLYYGHWICFSSPFDWHPIAVKMHFMTTKTPSGGNVNPSGKDNYVVNALPNGNGITTTTQINWDNCTYNPRPNYAVQICTKAWGENRGHVQFVPGRWYWLESQATMNSVGNGLSSSHDGILRVWVDDVLIMEHFDVVFRTVANDVWQNLANTPILGGGGMTINQYQYMYYDHNVISTQRIGMPGSVPTDTTPPASPSNFQVN